jgi:exopolyphosphatase/guanosine-5'-triphosphate,3'-diphosphate pyrophosphatase
MLLNEQSKLPSAIFEWLQKELNPRMKYEAIATGGNINSAMKILDKKQREPVGIEELQSLLKTLNKLSKTQRMKKFKLREDRADVIVPALNIYNQIAVAAKVQARIAGMVVKGGGLAPQAAQGDGVASTSGEGEGGEEGERDIHFIYEWK